MPAHVAVIGGGISGLSAAYELHRAGIATTLIEASDRLGGALRTEYRDGFIIDAGPDSFLSSKPGAIQLATDLSIDDHIIGTRPDGGGTFIVRDSKLQPLPEGITMLVPAQFRQIIGSPLLSLTGKARLLAEWFIPSRKDDADESVAAFMTRRVGRQPFERLAEPLLSGIYSGDAWQLGILSTFPRLRAVEREHGGLIRGAIAQRRGAAKQPAPARRYTPFVSFERGLSELTTALVEALAGVDIHTNLQSTAVESTPSGYRIITASGASIEADAVIIATPAPATAQMLDEISPATAGELRDIPYVSSATVSMAFREADLTGRVAGRGFVVPRAEQRFITAATWSSQKFAGRTPEGLALLRGFAGRAGREQDAELPEDQLIERVRADLADITGLRTEPVFAEVFRWPKAMPQYLVGHQDRLARIESAMAAHPRIGLTGAAYRGVGIPDCISNARDTARTIISQLS